MTTNNGSPPKKLKANVRLNSVLPQHNTKVRREFLDADYLKDISKEDLLWYAQFIDESVGGSVEKTKAGKVKAGYLHDTKELAKKCYDANNRQNRDIYGVSRANGFLRSIDWEIGETNDGWYVTNPHYTEDALIVGLDNEAERSDTLNFKEYVMLRKNMTEEARLAYDARFAKECPNADMYYKFYDEKAPTEKQLERFIVNPKLLDKIFKESKLVKGKDSSTNRTKRR